MDSLSLKQQWRCGDNHCQSTYDFSELSLAGLSHHALSQWNSLTNAVAGAGAGAGASVVGKGVGTGVGSAVGLMMLFVNGDGCSSLLHTQSKA